MQCFALLVNFFFSCFVAAPCMVLQFNTVVPLGFNHAVKRRRSIAMTGAEHKTDCETVHYKDGSRDFSHI